MCSINRLSDNFGGFSTPSSQICDCPLTPGKDCIGHRCYTNVCQVTSDSLSACHQHDHVGILPGPGKGDLTPISQMRLLSFPKSPSITGQVFLPQVPALSSVSQQNRKSEDGVEDKVRLTLRKSQRGREAGAVSVTGWYSLESTDILQKHPVSSMPPLPDTCLL